MEVDEDRARVPAEEILVEPVDVVVALLARRDPALGEKALGTEQRAVRVGPKVREVEPTEYSKIGRASCRERV